jgi:hypothetical protein
MNEIGMSLNDARFAAGYELRAYLVDSELVVIRSHRVVDVALSGRGVRHRAGYLWLLTERRFMDEGLGL